MRIYGSLYSATPDTFTAFRTATIDGAGRDGLNLPYKKVGADFFVYSGFKRGLIVYSKTIFGCNDVAEKIEIGYPVSNKSLDDSLLARLAAGLDVRPSMTCP